MTDNKDYKRVERIEKLLELEGLKRKDLADKLDMWAQNLSRDLTTGKISDKRCRKIHELFPKYRLEWLLGDSDHMTNGEVFYDELQKMNEEGKLLHQGFFSLAKLSGFQIDIAPLSKEYGAETIADTLHNMKEFCTVTRDGKSVTFSLSDLNKFENEISDYVELRLSYMIK